MLPEENNRPAPAMGEICKDFAIIHANAESALNLLRGLDEKLKKEIAANPPAPGDGDRYYQFYALRMNCLDCTAALLRGFDSEFGQDILRRAEEAIAEEFESERATQEANEAHYESEKAIAAEADEAWTLIGNSLVEIGQALEGDVILLSYAVKNKDAIEIDELSEYLDALKSKAKKNQARLIAQHRKDLILERSLRKIKLLVLPLLRMANDTGFQDDDGDDNEDKDTLIESAIEILKQELKAIREGSIPY
ncbi:hypothetical protein [Laspinema palackyanum]|uniref:hypothetical protein n=1 Tax=Laspinema palackyanum TaxID=3231601 RepID=UPI00345E027B|nr:hypothetical protein [Laspinema sp. D2c]